MAKNRRKAFSGLGCGIARLGLSSRGAKGGNLPVGRTHARNPTAKSSFFFLSSCTPKDSRTTTVLPSQLVALLTYLP